MALGSLAGLWPSPNHFFGNVGLSGNDGHLSFHIAQKIPLNDTMNMTIR